MTLYRKMERKALKLDLAEQQERMEKAVQALVAEAAASAQTLADISPKAKPRQGERTQSLLERLMSPLPKEEPLDDDVDCEAAIALIHKTRRASISHFQLSLGWGYNHAARVLDLLWTRGIVGEKTDPRSYEILDVVEQEV